MRLAWPFFGKGQLVERGVTRRVRLSRPRSHESLPEDERPPDLPVSVLPRVAAAASASSSADFKPFERQLDVDVAQKHVAVLGNERLDLLGVAAARASPAATGTARPLAVRAPTTARAL